MPTSTNPARTSRQVGILNAFADPARYNGSLPLRLAVGQGTTWLIGGVNLCVAILAIAADRGSVPGRMQIVVTAEAAGRCEVARVSGIRAPCHFHGGKDVATIQILERCHGLRQCLVIGVAASRPVKRTKF